MKIIQTHIILEIYESDATKGHTETNIFQAVRKVYELEDGTFIIENPRDTQQLETMSRKDFRKMEMDYMTYNGITYERDNYLDKPEDSDNEYR